MGASHSAPIDNKATILSMREQSRQRHVPRNVPRRSAEHDLAEPGVTIGAHHEQVGIEIGGTRQDFVADADFQAMTTRRPMLE
jgi:hypothetical protein